MKDFSVFLADGSVKKQQPDMNLSEDLIRDCQERIEDARISLKMGRKAKFIYENAYEALREAADSVLFAEGYKSFSHEATISFLQRFKGISVKEISEFDRMRIKRNGMKYYGKSCSVEEAKEAVEFAENLIKKLIEMTSFFV